MQNSVESRLGTTPVCCEDAKYHRTAIKLEYSSSLLLLLLLLLAATSPPPSLLPRRRPRCYLAAAFALPRRRPRCYPAAALAATPSPPLLLCCLAAVLMPPKYCDSVRNTVETCLAAGVKPIEIASKVRVSHHWVYKLQ